MPSTTTVAGALLLAGAAAANPFTTIDVCPGADPTISACTVTAQHQPISTCSPVSTTCSTQASKSWGGWEASDSTSPATTLAPSDFKSCSTAYSYSTWAWVSTVIPCNWNGQSMSSCTVTSTQQNVPCEMSVTTSTSSTPTHTNYITNYVTHTVTLDGAATPTWSVDSSVSTVIDYSTSYQTISKMWEAPYNMLGPNAIPGYSGNDLYHDGSSTAGESAQWYNVTECEAWNGAAPSCSVYTENHYNSISGYHSGTPVTATNSIHTSVPSAGTYTFSFANNAPAATITSGGQTYTHPAQPWFNYETRTADGPMNFDFTVTVTKTITIYWPGSTSAGHPSPVAPSNVGHGWGNWNAPSTPTAGGDPSNAQGWNNWGNAAPHGSSPSSQTGAPWSGHGGFPGFPGAPGTGTFYIPVDSSSGSKYSTSGNKWIGFPNGGDDGAVVSGQGNAAKFYWDANGNLMCNGQYVSTSTSAGYLVFELGPNVPSGPKFSVGPNGGFGLPGAGFCATDDTLFITFGGSPNGCRPVSCPLNGGNAAASSTTGWGQWAAASSSSWSTQTSSTSSWTGTSTNGPSTTGPSTTGPSTAGPSTTGPSTTGPSTTGPSTTGLTTIVTTTTGPTTIVTTTTGPTIIVTTTTAPTTTGATTTGPSTPTGSRFALSVVLSGSRMARRADTYLAFSGNNAIFSTTNIAYFQFANGFLTLDGTTSTVGATSSSGSTQIQSFPAGSGNALSNSFDISSGGLSYPGAGFCATGSAVNIYFGSAPAGCLSLSLGVDYNPSFTTPTTTADPSGDLDTPAPTARVKRRSHGLQL